jgi:tryptophan synthase alpha chain
LILNNRIDKKLNLMKSDSEPVLVPYITSGFPNIHIFKKIVLEILDNGADILEIGIPFSDPLADGPTIQKSNYIALKNGVNLKKTINLLTEIRASNNVSPMVFMGYYNPFLSYGIDDFLRDASKAGLDGLIIPDLPTEESNELFQKCLSHGIHLIPLLAPTSTDETIKQACKQAGGYIYCVSLTGVTGARSQLSSEVKKLVRRIKTHTDLPVLVGFGISTRSNVLEVNDFADGAVVGSAFIDHISNSSEGSEVESAVKFIRSLKYVDSNVKN